MDACEEPAKCVQAHNRTPKPAGRGGPVENAPLGAITCLDVVNTYTDPLKPMLDDVCYQIVPGGALPKFSLISQINISTNVRAERCTACVSWNNRTLLFQHNIL